MKMLSATDLAISLAIRSGSLTVVERPSRLGGTFVAIGDEHGIIEVADDMDAANTRLNAIRERMA